MRQLFQLHAAHDVPQVVVVVVAGCPAAAGPWQAAVLGRCCWRQAGQLSRRTVSRQHMYSDSNGTLIVHRVPLLPLYMCCRLVVLRRRRRRGSGRRQRSRHRQS
eukprot:TRINITY_DN9197_c0_g1_i2.p4 TRINITY_DN9197_c0_g1~~TRINITY_DN9197_c0_g1_i2.p4  ORF type:complete len:104 (-),score=13.90 TRINITY_DN9197_c0_g1_i2:689-1000(-)